MFCSIPVVSVALTAANVKQINYKIVKIKK